MKFKNIDELVRYIIDENINLNYTDIEFNTNLNESSITNNISKNIIEIKLFSLSDQPVCEAELGDENILYVESYESLKNICGAGKICMFGKTILSNICEIDDVAHLNMLIDFNKNNNYNIPFKLKLLSEKPENAKLIQLDKSILNESTKETN